MIDYSFYTETYLGSAIPEEEFPSLVQKADYRLEALTFARHRDPKLPAATVLRVNLAVCAIAELLYSFAEPSDAPAFSANVEEERVGSHQVKYRDAISTEQALSAQIRSVASAYLLTTGLLNRVCKIID